MACKVELRDVHPNASWQEKDIAFRKMFSTFKKRVAEANILHRYKQHEFYESPGEKRRRKQKEAEAQRIKQMLRENFPEKRKMKYKEERNEQ